MIDLAALLRPTATDDPRRFRLDVPDGLQQGKGAWGGVATGAMVAAVQKYDPRPEFAVRSLSAHLVAPLLVGPVSIELADLRRGSATNTVVVRVVDDAGAVVAHGVVVLGAPRSGQGIPDGPGWLAVEPPEELAAGPEAVPEVPLGPPVAPHFLRVLQIRPISGLPFSGRPTGVSSGWVAPVAPVSQVDAPVLVALADAWWVAVMAGVDRPRPVGTLGFTVDLPIDPATLPCEPDGRLRPLFHRGRTIAAREGYTVETRELWTVDGRLASWNVQTVVVIK